MNNKRFTFLIIVNVLLLTFSGCTTTKNTFMHRAWHNMNSRYNGYFYARENTKETIKTVEKDNKDDFTSLLPIFIYPSGETAQNYSESFDAIIEKASTVIHRHAITHHKTKEEIPNACRWIDENYMLIGQAQFYKRDYISAEEVFTYVAQKYPNPEAKYIGLIWMIHTYNELGSLSLSEPIIDEIRNAEDFPKDKAYHRAFTAVTADYYIKRVDYEQAIKYLKEAIAITKKKQLKARYLFILAQLYEKIGDKGNALKNFVLVPGLHPSYEMEFTAQMNQAKLYDSGLGDSKAIKKQLMKMLKDSKNTEYLDQIYYALAQIAYKEKDTELAINYLQQSVENSVSNDNQKALSFLKIADISFDQTKYTVAEANYDSTVTYLSKDYPSYDQIVIKRNSLKDLVINLNIIAREDSLLVLSKMSDKERRKAVRAIMANLQKEKEAKEQARQQVIENKQQISQNQLASPSGLLLGSTAWYFYNPTTVSFGRGEFTKKWGNRMLENNWRRSEKEQDTFAEIGDIPNTPDGINNPATGASSIAVIKEDEVSIDDTSYLKNIPVTPAAIALSNNKIIEAYYQVGSIYKEQLLNNEKSIIAFEKLLKKYPNNKYKLTVYYQLYRTFLSINNNKKADYYKNMLLNDYPDTEYAKLIKNPDYGKMVMANKNVIEKLYQEAFQFYKEEKYVEAIRNCINADSLYANNHLMPQFDLLRALCIGETQSALNFVGALKSVVVRRPETPAQARAQELLDLIEQRRIEQAPKGPPKFEFSEGGDYYWMAVVENDTLAFNAMVMRIKDIVEINYKSLNLEIVTNTLNTTRQALTLRVFKGKSQLLMFDQGFKSRKSIYADMEKGTYKLFLISKDNYLLLAENKKFEEFEEFYKTHFE